MDDGEKVNAKYEYTAAEGATQELSMSRGEVLTLLDDSKTWWKVKNSKGKVGYVPSNYIVRNSKQKKEKPKKIPQPTTQTQPKLNRNLNGKVDYFNDWIKKTKKEMLKRKKKRDGHGEKYCLALYTYNKTRDDELDLHKGQRVLILEESEDDWWRGRNMETGHDGWFPSNYVEHVAADNHANSQATEQNQSPLDGYSNNSPVIDHVRCLYSFQAKTAEELSFSENDELDIIGKVEEDPDWWVGRNMDGRIGLVPRIYTEIMSQQAPPQHEPPAPSVSAGPYAAMRQKSWFFENVKTRSMAEEALRGANEGEFLVRPSEGFPGALSISVRGRNKNKHFKVTNPENQYLIGQRKFGTVDELISNYIKNPIFSDGAEKLYLVRSLPNREY